MFNFGNFDLESEEIKKLQGSTNVNDQFELFLKLIGLWEIREQINHVQMADMRRSFFIGFSLCLVLFMERGIQPQEIEKMTLQCMQIFQEENNKMKAIIENSFPKN